MWRTEGLERGREVYGAAKRHHEGFVAFQALNIGGIGLNIHVTVQYYFLQLHVNL
jgi:hypothetical protein